MDEIVSYLLGPCLWIPSTDYPDFLDWAQKVHDYAVRLFLMKHQYKTVRKEDLYGLNSGKDIIYQKNLVL